MNAFYSVRNGTWEMNVMQHNQQGKNNNEENEGFVVFLNEVFTYQMGK